MQITKNTKTNSKKISPLAGVNILVTRARSKGSALSELLQDQGASIIELPLLELKSLSPKEFLYNGISRLDQYDWIFFASTIAVEAFMTIAASLNITPAQINHKKLAAIGPATVCALQKWQLQPTFQPTTFVAESLVKEFPGYPNLDGIHILWPRGNKGRSFITEKMSKAGAHVEIIEVYSSQLSDTTIGKQLLELITTKAVDIITLTSGETVRNFKTLLTIAIKETADRTRTEIQNNSISKEYILTLLDNVQIAVIGPQTAAAAHENLGKVDIEAQTYTIAGLVEAIIEHMS